ncbi:MAG TPA: DUF3857 and transglutaminase domain-containing protein [Ideonella sp.]|uniref:DUF3857 domain-containing transglutaminase family protein n=1 Tax=Ideonella sp. TaxID=1929293 RepID=UPI002E2FBF96|nr:DUF3857 and transglutaminase domain-containing protein [Ideonella sp.]HEX5687172.1 DUF3857 and transglutaminase domain-containing protein [Ideonella sp.]
MKNGWKRLALPLILAATVNSTAAKTGEPEPIQDLPIRFGHYHVDYVINDDVTSSETRSWSTTVLKTQAIDWVKRANVSYSTSVQKAEVLEAYTRKADGRRIDVPKENYQININKGREPGGPAFSDFSSLSVVFPDVAVGDTVVFSYRVSQSEPIFPGQFDAGQTFSRQGAYDDVRVSIDYPAALKARFETRDMQQSEPPAATGRRTVQWRWSNPKPVRNDRANYSVYDPDKEVGFDFSTFKDYVAIADAYGLRATPKAAVTERVKQLAAEIVGNHQEPAAQARSLYEWVATKITYGGNCVGVGTVVPRDLDFVIDNRMGDCKDHATLLQALLAARGIESQQALVNAGSVYTLPRVPRVSSVNHVINYIPSLKLYVDSTSNITPFGSLPPQLRGKPVLLVGSDTTPRQLPVPSGASEQRTVSKLKIGADGSMSGTVEAHFKGDTAVSMREWARNQTTESREDMVKNMLRSMGMSGKGRVEMDDATELSDQYRVKLVIDQADKFIRFPGSGAFYVSPLLGGLVIASIVAPDTGEPVEHAGTCTSGKAVEEYTIELPKKMKVVSLPDKASLSNSVQRYDASYSLKGNVLQVRRTFEDKTSVAVCSPEILKDYQRLGGQVYENLKAQVLYK